jgi:competence protein ComEA
VPDDVPFPLPPRPSPSSAWAERLHAWRRDPRVGIVALLVCALVAGGFWFRAGITKPAGAGAGPDASTPGAPAAPGVEATTTSAATAPTTLVVHVAGAVARPGVVTVAAGSRVVDALDAAGGATADADLDRLNLAAPLSDGARIAVPRRGQPPPPLDAGASGGAGAPAGGAGDGATAGSGPVNLNTATQAELESLPGIGPALATAIIDERERSGGFRAVTDLRRVRGIGDARFAQIEALVTV